MTIVERKLKFHDLFGSMGKMTLEDDLFKDDKFIDRFEEVFGVYVAGIHSSSKLDIYASREELYFRVYDAISHARVVYTRDSPLQAVKMTGAMLICLSYFDRKLAYEYLIRNLTPLYNRLSKVDGIIEEEEEIRDIDSFIFVNIAKHMMGHPTDVSETIYAYFLEAEEERPFDEVRNHKYFKHIATYFSITEKEELFDCLSKLYADYPILNEYEITLVGIGADTAGKVSIDKKIATITLGDGQGVSTVIHEMGHIIARTVNYSSLDLSRANEYEVSVYALTSKEEMFCELLSNKYCSRDRYKVRVAKELLGGI